MRRFRRTSSLYEDRLEMQPREFPSAFSTGDRAISSLESSRPLALRPRLTTGLPLNSLVQVPRLHRSQGAGTGLRRGSLDGCWMRLARRRGFLPDDGHRSLVLQPGEDVLHLPGDLLVDLFMVRIRAEALGDVDRGQDLDRDLRRQRQADRDVEKAEPERGRER